MARTIKLLAALYAIAFTGSAFWAWGNYLVNQDAARERLLPSIMFNVVCLPSSLLMAPFTDWSPRLLESVILQYSLLTLLGLLQIACLALIAARLNRRSRIPG